MANRRAGNKFSIIDILWERKLFYLLGWILGMFIVLLNLALGSNIEIDELIIIPISSSFIFGFLLYLFIREPEKVRKEGRLIIFSKEGLIHFGLSFGSLIIFYIILNIF